MLSVAHPNSEHSYISNKNLRFDSGFAYFKSVFFKVNTLHTRKHGLFGRESCLSRSELFYIFSRGLFILTWTSNQFNFKRFTLCEHLCSFFPLQCSCLSEHQSQLYHIGLLWAAFQTSFPSLLL